MKKDQNKRYNGPNKRVRFTKETKKTKKLIAAVVTKQLEANNTTSKDDDDVKAYIMSSIKEAVANISTAPTAGKVSSATTPTQGVPARVLKNIIRKAKTGSK